MASASLQRRGKGWRVIWREGGRGSKRHPSETFFDTPQATGRQLAEDERQRLLARLKAREALGNRTLVPIGEVLERWLLAVQTEKHASALYVQKSRTTLGRIIKAKGWATTADVTREQAGGIGRGAMRLLRAMLHHAETYDQVVDRHLWHLPLPPRPERPKVELLTDAQVRQLLAEAKRWGNEAVAHLLVTYGHRPESVAQALISDVDFAAGTIELPVKSIGALRRVRHPLLPATLKLLRRVVRGRPAGEHLLLDHNGQPWKTGQAIAQWWYDSVGRAVLGAKSRACGVYQLKRYAISRMLARGLDVATIASITGHATPTALLTYARTNEQRQRTALAALAAGSGATPVSPGRRTKATKRR